MRIGLRSDPVEWVNMRWKATQWIGQDKKCTKSQVNTLQALATIAANPSPVAVSSLLHPVFSANDIFGGVASVSGSSATSASSKEEAHYMETKQLLTVIVKGATSGQGGKSKQNVKTNLKAGTARSKTGAGEGKHAERNARRRVNAKKGPR